MEFKDKKADSRLLFPFVIFLWVLVVVALSIGLAIFNASRAEVKGEEARILGYRLIDCLVEQGTLNPETFEKDFNVYGECGLNNQIINDSGYFYFRVLLKLEEEGQEQKILSGGKSILLDFSELEAKEEDSPKSFKKEIKINYLEEREVLEVIAVSNNRGKKKI